jgi:inner membrane protein involved in colicin E2 resistance
LEKKYEGFIFSRQMKEKEKELGLYSYHVYLLDLKIIGKIVTNRLLEDDTKYLFQLYVFNDEETFKKKIRLNFII